MVPSHVYSDWGPWLPGTLVGRGAGRLLCNLPWHEEWAVCTYPHTYHLQMISYLEMFASVYGLNREYKVWKKWYCFLRKGHLWQKKFILHNQYAWLNMGFSFKKKLEDLYICRSVSFYQRFWFCCIYSG